MHRMQGVTIDTTMHNEPNDITPIGVGSYHEPITVDPVRRDHWQYDGGLQHADSRARGAALDVKAANDSRGALSYATEENFYEPRAFNFFIPAPCGLSGWKGLHGDKWKNERSIYESTRTNPWNLHKQSYTQMPSSFPAVSQLRRDARLPEKTRGQIEAEMRISERRQGDRLFDKSGGKRP